MNKEVLTKRLYILSAVIAVVAIVIYFVIFGIKNIKINEFQPVAVTFLIDSSASNQKNIESQKRFVKQLCKNMDPEDKIKIIRVSEDAYLIYEGSPQDSAGISKSLDSFTKFSPEECGTAYGDAMKKAIGYCLVMKRDGYVPAVVTIGDLENEGATSKQLDWNTFPKNIQTTVKYAPDLTLMFVWAHPSKLDFVKNQLIPVMSEDKLIIATEEMTGKVSKKFFKSIGR